MARTAHPKPRRHNGKWRIRWKDEYGHRRSEVYDRYEDAVFKLKQHLLRVEEIKRGLRGLEPPKRTFKELDDTWIKTRLTEKRSPHHDESILRAHLRPFFNGYYLHEIDSDLVRSFVDERRHLNPKTINNHLILLKAMLNEARMRKWLAEVPRIPMFKIPLFSEDYCWLRTRQEIDRFLLAAKQEGELAFALYVTAVYTGMRQGELAGLKWDAVDFEKRIIAVQSSFNGPTKSRKVRYVPILDALLPVLRQWRLLAPGVWVFPNHAGKMHTPSSRIFQEILHRILDAAGFPKHERNGRTRRYIVFHDLRHTFASHWVLNDGDIFRLQKILGHKDTVMTMRYAHLAPEAFASDYGRMGGMDAAQFGEVVSLPVAKG